MSDYSYMAVRERQLKEEWSVRGGDHHRRALRDIIVDYKASLRRKNRKSRRS
jgi:hypothetical protein